MWHTPPRYIPGVEKDAAFCYPLETVCRLRGVVGSGHIFSGAMVHQIAMSLKQRRGHKRIRQHKKWCKDISREIREAHANGSLEVCLSNDKITLSWGRKMRVEGARVQLVRVSDTLR